MVDWKLYIDSHQKRALDLCGGSLDDGGGWGYGGGGSRCGDGYGNGYGGGYGRSSNKW